MDVWQALAGVGAFMKGKQMAEDRSREIQQQQEQADWMKRQRAHQEKQWAIEEERNAREAKRLPMLEEMDKLNLETAKLGADAKKREFDFEYKLPAKNLSGLTNPPMAGAMMAASGMPTMAGLAPQQLTPMVPDQAVSVDRPVPYSKQLAEDKVQAQFGKMQNEIEHRQKVLELQERNADLREKQIMGGLVARGVVPGGSVVGGTTMNTPPKQYRVKSGTLDKLSPQARIRVNKLIEVAQKDPDERNREEAMRVLINEGIFDANDPDLYQPQAGKTGSTIDPADKEKKAAVKLYKKTMDDLEKQYRAETGLQMFDAIPAEDMVKLKKMAAEKSGYDPNSLASAATAPVKNIRPDVMDKTMQMLLDGTNRQMQAQQEAETKRQRIEQAQKDSGVINPNSAITNTPSPNRNLLALDAVVKALGRIPNAKEMQVIQQMVDNGYNTQSILDLLQHQ